MRREGLEHGEKGCWKGPSLQALACSAAYGVIRKTLYVSGGKFETRSVWRNVFRLCSPKIPNRRNLENFPSGRRGCGERWEELPGFTTRLSKGPKFFFEEALIGPENGADRGRRPSRPVASGARVAGAPGRSREPGRGGMELRGWRPLRRPGLPSGASSAC